MNEPGADMRSVADDGAAAHHWLAATVLGALLGGVGVLVNWILLRAFLL